MTISAVMTDDDIRHHVTTAWASVGRMKLALAAEYAELGDYTSASIKADEARKAFERAKDQIEAYKAADYTGFYLYMATALATG